MPNLDEAALFNAARQIQAPDARRAYLQEACGDDQKLRLRVEALLRAHEEGPTFLASPAVALPAGAPGVLEASGTQIGPYQLSEQVGEGGFGVVFTAEQRQPIRRTVAVKIVKPGMDTRQVVARFEAERQALALMDHPNIARVLDGGETASGRPYFVMELVQGVPITRYCDAHQLMPRERLGLFMDVCQAVQHAHQKGIIHRDIKPSNVLVALRDGNPVPKVIDFGVAKALGQRLTERTVVTGLGDVVGTLEYMSPEQANFLAADIDTRADVYGLGVVLYELLTGTTPLTHERLGRVTITEALHLIRDEDPPKPSDRLRAAKESLASVAAQRKLEPARLIREVRGELDWIVMKALEKDRARRYESASALARDVERYLNDEPVEACPPSAGYRLRKFARKHRKMLGAAAAFALLLTAATAVSAWLAVRATLAERAADRERAQAVAEKERADEQAAIAKAVKNFLQKDLLAQATAYKQAGPGRKPDRDIKVRTLLDRAGAKIAGKFEDQPLVEAEIRNTLAITYDLLGEPAKAEVHAARARELFVRALGPEDLRSVNATNNLANTLKAQRRPNEARKLFEEVLQVSRRVFGPDHPATLGAMNNLANTLSDLRLWDEARKLHEEALEGRRRVNGVKAPATLQSMNNLAVVLRIQGRFDEARKLHEETLGLQQEVLGPESPDTLGSMHNIAFVLGLQGHVKEAIQQYEHVLPIQRRVFGPEHPARLQAMNDLAWLLATASDPKLRNPRRAIELAKEVVQYSPRRGDRWNTLGVAYYRAGDWKNAILALEKSLEFAPKESVADNGFFLAMAHWQLGEKDKARQWYGKAAGWMEKNRPDDQELRQFRAEASRLLGLPERQPPGKKAGK
jgi:serine/threonine protein kinase/Flp pilus assembly protein TadD